VFFAERDAVVRAEGAPRMAGWRRLLFAFLYRNAARVVDRFALEGVRFVAVGRLIGL
jgi:KUP system potassium uptake protein